MVGDTRAVDMLSGERGTRRAAARVEGSRCGKGSASARLCAAPALPGPAPPADAGDYVCRVANRVAAKEARANVSIKSRAAGGRLAGSVRPSVRPSVGAAFLPHPF